MFIWSFIEMLIIIINEHRELYYIEFFGRIDEFHIPSVVHRNAILL